MQRKWTPSQILLVIGLVILLAGCVLAYLKVEPYADYVLVVGALLVIVRGSLRTRERKDEELKQKVENSEK